MALGIPAQEPVLLWGGGGSRFGTGSDDFIKVAVSTAQSWKRSPLSQGEREGSPEGQSRHERSQQGR